MRVLVQGVVSDLGFCGIGFQTLGCIVLAFSASKDWGATGVGSHAGFMVAVLSGVGIVILQHRDVMPRFPRSP